MPYRKLAHRKERLRVYRLTLELTKIMHYSIYDGMNFGATVDGLFVGCCVGIGHAESRPMTATKIAHYLNMSRTTVLRKLDELIELGAIERIGHYYVVSERRMGRVDWLNRSNVTIASFAKEIIAELEQPLRGKQ